MSKKRQSNAYHKQRKAKARAKHQAEFRSWADRKKTQPKPRPTLNPFAGQALSLAAMEAMIAQWDRPAHPYEIVFRGDKS